jgi:hypothetical protein
MTRKLNKLRILSFVAGCAVIVLPALLCGCNSEKDKEDKEIATHLQQAKADYAAERYQVAAVSYEKIVAIRRNHEEAYYGLYECYDKIGETFRKKDKERYLHWKKKAYDALNIYMGLRGEQAGSAERWLLKRLFDELNREGLFS